jgi:ribose transport system permease protein
LISTTNVETKSNGNNIGFFIRKRLFGTQEFGIFIAFILLCIFFTIQAPVFASFSNLMNLGRQISTTGIMAVGMTILIICGEFDLSVGSIFCITSGLCALMMLSGMPILAAVLLSLLLSVLIGMINGIITAYGRIPSFVTGLGMANLLRGVFLLISGGMPATISGFLPSGKAADAFFFIGKGRLFGVIPMMLIFFFIVLALGIFFLKKTRLGFSTYAVGGNPKAAHIAGLSVKWTKIIAFTLTGLTAGIAAILQLSFIGTVTGQTGSGYELDALSAAFIGGTNPLGGAGSLVGTFLGAAIVGALRNGLVLTGVSPFWQMVAIGMVIIVAVGIDQWTNKKRA